METEKRPVVHEVLKSLCLNNGWSYGVFWSFDRRNSLLLTMEDAYYEDQMGTLIENMLLQVHVLGNGIIGDTAFEKGYQWIFAENYRRDTSPLGYARNHEISQDKSEIPSQFSSGVETIAIISVEPHGVVQFGSARKILEMIEFVDQTKRLFREIGNRDEFTLPGSTTSSSNRKICGRNSLISTPALHSSSGNVEIFDSASSYNYMGTSFSSADIQNVCPFALDHGVTKSSNIENQLRSNDTESAYFQPNDFSFNPYKFLIDFPYTYMPQSVIQNDIFDNLGVDFEFGELENIFDDISVPIMSGGKLEEVGNISDDISMPIEGGGKSEKRPTESGGKLEKTGNISDVMSMPVMIGAKSHFRTDISECISEQCVGSFFAPRESLFSKLGIDHLEGTTSKPYSFTASSSDCRLSSGMKRKKAIGSDCQSSGSSFVTHPNRSEESVNVKKKRAKPGSRPKPKDRQQIQDRIAELRKLIPNGVKMSIDSLLAQTIKQMFFLESVTKHAENLKRAEARKDNEYIDAWVLQNQVQSMVDPVDVKDLSLPGQKQIQIFCDEKGFFLELADIIQGFGLIILKGTVEVRDDKIWACFVVESEVKKYITKQDIYLSLHQLLSQKALSEINSWDEPANNSVNGRGINLFNNYHHAPKFPINFSDGLL